MIEWLIKPEVQNWVVILFFFTNVITIIFFDKMFWSLNNTTKKALDLIMEILDNNKEI